MLYVTRSTLSAQLLLPFGIVQLKATASFFITETVSVPPVFGEASVKAKSPTTCVEVNVFSSAVGPVTPVAVSTAAVVAVRVLLKLPARTTPSSMVSFTATARLAVIVQVLPPEGIVQANPVLTVFRYSVTVMVLLGVPPPNVNVAVFSVPAVVMVVLLQLPEFWFEHEVESETYHVVCPIEVLGAAPAKFAVDVVFPGVADESGLS